MNSIELKAKHMSVGDEDPLSTLCSNHISGVRLCALMYVLSNIIIKKKGSKSTAFTDGDAWTEKVFEAALEGRAEFTSRPKVSESEICRLNSTARRR